MKILLQIGVVLGICLAGEWIAALLPAAIPGSVIAMVLLFILLAAGLLKPEHIREKADFLMKNMALFFIPAGVGVLEYFDVLRENLPALLAVCFLTTVLTFGATALTVRGVTALQERGRKRRGK